jgi:THO complex subunit 2
LSHQSSPSKSRLKEDGLNVSVWMQSLSSFCGNLYKKYPSIELVGLLQYITNAMKSGQGLQLLVLRELVTKMAGGGRGGE